MSNVSSQKTSAMDRAIERLKRGESVEAEEVMLESAEEARKVYGEQSPEYANAQNGLGTILVNVRQYSRAAEAYQAACEGPPPNEEEWLRDHMTYMLNLGQAHMMDDQLDEAERVLREGLELRRDYYGRNHPGYAFGLESLGEVMLRKDQPAEAVEMFEETVGNFQRDGHLRIATSMAFRAEAYAALGRDSSLFEGLERLPDHVLVEVANHVHRRVQNSDPLLMRTVLSDFVPILEERLGLDHQVTLNMYATIANIERTLNDHREPYIQIHAARKLVESYQRQGRAADSLNSMLGLAMALGDAGESDETLQTYQDAEKYAITAGDRVMQARVLRDHGCYLRDLERDEESISMLRKALRISDEVDEPQVRANIYITLGIQLQHDGNLDEARDLILEGLKYSDPAHDDALCGRSHLEAIKSGDSDGCGDMGKAMSDALRQQILSRLADNLVKRLEVELVDDDFQIKMELNREIDDEEARHLNRVVQHTLDEFRDRLRQR